MPQSGYTVFEQRFESRTCHRRDKRDKDFWYEENALCFSLQFDVGGKHEFEKWCSF
jgi:hypothetical protein